jgi:outer membrane protein assembly factor BamE (lipoprotein component of BamABCDE complex)
MNLEEPLNWTMSLLRVRPAGMFYLWGFFRMKIQSICSVIGIAIALVAVGCASTGNETLRAESESSVSKKMIEGQSTKADVRKIFGSPLRTSFTDGGLEIWTFEFSNVSADAVSYIPIVSMFGGTASGTKKELVVMFDDKGVVKRYAMSESAVTNKTGFFNN